jgi:hypothetical protein
VHLVNHSKSMHGSSSIGYKKTHGHKMETIFSVESAPVLVWYPLDRMTWER